MSLIFLNKIFQISKKIREQYNLHSLPDFTNVNIFIIFAADIFNKKRNTVNKVKTPLILFQSMLLPRPPYKQ